MPRTRVKKNALHLLDLSESNKHDVEWQRASINIKYGSKYQNVFKFIYILDWAKGYCQVIPPTIASAKGKVCKQIVEVRTQQRAQGPMHIDVENHLHPSLLAPELVLHFLHLQMHERHENVFSLRKSFCARLNDF